MKKQRGHVIIEKLSYLRMHINVGRILIFNSVFDVNIKVLELWIHFVHCEDYKKIMDPVTNCEQFIQHIQKGND